MPPMLDLEDPAWPWPALLPAALERNPGSPPAPLPQPPQGLQELPSSSCDTGTSLEKAPVLLDPPCCFNTTWAQLDELLSAEAAGG